MSESHDEYGNCTSDQCRCDYARYARSLPDEPKVGDHDLCACCDQHIYGDRWGAWRHYDTGLVCCGPFDSEGEPLSADHAATPSGAV